MGNSSSRAKEMIAASEAGNSVHIILAPIVQFNYPKWVLTYINDMELQDGSNLISKL